MQVEDDDVGGLLLKVRIIRSHVALETLRLEAVLAPHSRDDHVRDPESLGELTGAPVRRGRRLALNRPLENACLELRGERARGSAAHGAHHPLARPDSLLADSAPRVPPWKD